ncbi:hypothetical protein U1Q18_030922 [Sarracenia purpurea var. burkii]
MRCTIDMLKERDGDEQSRCIDQGRDSIKIREDGLPPEYRVASGRAKRKRITSYVDTMPSEHRRAILSGDVQVLSFFHKSRPVSESRDGESAPNMVFVVPSSMLSIPRRALYRIVGKLCHVTEMAELDAEQPMLSSLPTGPSQALYRAPCQA